MAKREIVSKRQFTMGVHEIPEVSMGRLERFVRPTLSRLNWPPGKVMKFTQYYSFDGGLSWVEWGSAVFDGGTIADNKTGRVLEVSDMLPSAVDEVDNRNRRVRWTMEVLQPLETDLHLETSETRIRTPEREGFR